MKKELYFICLTCLFSTCFYAQIFTPEVKVMTIPNNNTGIGTETPQYKLDVLGRVNATGFLINGQELNLDSLKNSSGNLTYMSGNVGIGTTSPSRRLEVFSGIGNLNQTQLRLGTVSPWFWDIGRDMSNGNFKILDEFGNIRFQINQSDGYVGIGTDSPQHALQVQGTVKATTFIADTPPWPDFVFSEKYVLRDLKSLENFILENKHLPEIPSEKEMKLRGLHLPEMDSKLLQKIEELTLYIIEQNKKLEAQQAEINELRAKIDNVEE